VLPPGGHQDLAAAGLESGADGHHAAPHARGPSSAGVCAPAALWRDQAGSAARPPSTPPDSGRCKEPGRDP